MVNKKIAFYGIIALIISLVASSAVTAYSEDEPLQVYMFYEDGCDDCAAFKPVMEQLVQDYGGIVSVTYQDVFTAEGWDLYVSYGFNKVPSVVIGDSAIQYEDDKFTYEYMSGIFDYYLDDESASDDNVVKLEYFYEIGCDNCDAFKPILDQLKADFGDSLIIVEYDTFTSEGWELFSGYGFMHVPSVAIDSTSTIEHPDTTYEILHDIIEEALEGGDTSFSNVTDWTLTVAFTLGFFSSFSPCLMAVLSFILAYTAGTSNKRSEAMGKSVLFGVGLVIMYSLIAVIMAIVGKQLTNLKFYMSLAGGMITLLLGLNLLNYVFQVVEFPVSTKGFSTKLVHQFVEGKGYMGAILLGVIFSAVKLPCAAPALVIILTRIMETGDMLYGLLLIAVFSMGVLLPFVFIGLISGGTTDVAKKVRWSGFFRALVWGGGGIVVLVVSVWMVYTAFDLLPVVTDTHFYVSLGAFTATLMIVVYALIRWHRKGPRKDIGAAEKLE